MAQREKAGQQITNFIGVSPIDEYVEKIEVHGGKVVEAKTPIVGWGYLAVCLDTEDNTFGLWEDDSNARM